jgi:outer membrane biosynthesis protein TonB
MGARKKEAQERQKAYFERRLEERLSFLSKKGTESPGIDKDTLVKKLRANIRAINDRLKAIAANEKRTAELAKIKAEKAALPPLPKDQAEGKGKKSKEAAEEGKEKKRKKEKEKGQDQEQKPGQEKEQKPEEEKKQEKKQEKKKEKKQEQEKEG